MAEIVEIDVELLMKFEVRGVPLETREGVTGSIILACRDCLTEMPMQLHFMLDDIVAAALDHVEGISRDDETQGL